MTEQNLSMKPGELIVFSFGMYSDYSYMGSFVVLRDIPETEMLQVAEMVNADHLPDAEDRFVAELIRRGCLLSINHREIHLGPSWEGDIEFD